MTHSVPPRAAIPIAVPRPACRGTPMRQLIDCHAAAAARMLPVD